MSPKAVSAFVVFTWALSDASFLNAQFVMPVDDLQVINSIDSFPQDPQVNAYLEEYFWFEAVDGSQPGIALVTGPNTDFNFCGDRVTEATVTLMGGPSSLPAGSYVRFGGIFEDEGYWELNPTNSPSDHFELPIGTEYAYPDLPVVEVPIGGRIPLHALRFTQNGIEFDIAYVDDDCSNDFFTSQSRRTGTAALLEPWEIVITPEPSASFSLLLAMLALPRLTNQRGRRRCKLAERALQY